MHARMYRKQHEYAMSSRNTAKKELPHSKYRAINGSSGSTRSSTMSTHVYQCTHVCGCVRTHEREFMPLETKLKCNKNN